VSGGAELREIQWPIRSVIKSFREQRAPRRVFDLHSAIKPRSTGLSVPPLTIPSG
jgi:hypothetical protein